MPALITLSKVENSSSTNESLCSTWSFFKFPTLTYFLQFMYKFVAEWMPYGNRDLVFLFTTLSWNSQCLAPHWCLVNICEIEVNESSHCALLGKSNHPLTCRMPDLENWLWLKWWDANHKKQKVPRLHLSISLSLVVHYTYLGLLQFWSWRTRGL